MAEKRKQGFATMTPEQRREVARKGGIAAQRQGVAHRWDREEASIAGRKGGRASVLRRRRGRSKS
jgi:general stress protein YciG